MAGTAGVISVSIGELSCLALSSFFNVSAASIPSEDTRGKGKSSTDDESVLWRDSAGSSFPRALFYDLQPHFSALVTPKDIQEEIQSAKNEWGAAKFQEVLQQSTPASQHWTKYLELVLPEKSQCGIPELSISDNFHHFSQGKGLIKEDSEIDFRERLRFFLEETHSTQGVQFFVDVDTAFSGMAAEFFEILADDYSKISTTCYAFRSLSPTSSEINYALSLHSLAPSASSFIPISTRNWSDKKFPMFEYQEDFGGNQIANSWKKITLASTAIYHSTLPYRLHPNNPQYFHFSKLYTSLSPSANSSILHLTSSLPFPFSTARINDNIVNFSTKERFIHSTSLFDASLSLYNESTQAQASPSEPPSSVVLPYSQSLCLSGFSPSLLRTDLPNYLAAQSNFGRCTIEEEGLELPETFPALSSQATKINSCPAMSTLERSPCIFPYLYNTATAFASAIAPHSTIGASSRPELREFHPDELKDISNSLWAIVDNYSDGK